jgi:hypothetical protein
MLFPPLMFRLFVQFALMMMMVAPAWAELREPEGPTQIASAPTSPLNVRSVEAKQEPLPRDSSAPEESLADSEKEESDPEAAGQSSAPMPEEARVAPIEGASIEAEPPPPAVAPLAAQQPIELVEPFHFITLIHASGRYGGVEEGDNLDQPRPITEGTGIASAGGQVTWGVIPASSFTMAARLRSGVFFGEGPPLAHAGAAVLVGSTFGNKKEDHFSYMFGGLGAEFIPARREDLLSVHATGGTVFGGFSLGGDIDFAVSPDKAFFMAGLHLGWGHLTR